MGRGFRGCLRASLCFLLLTLFAGIALAQDVPIPPAPTRWVTDAGGLLSPQAADQLDARLRAYEEQTQNQLIVWIGKTTGDIPIEDWANRAFNQWKLGRKGLDKGLALFVIADDHRLRIEVGYGLEPEVPDLRAKQIVDDILTPGLRAGNPVAAINGAMEAVAMAIGTPLPGTTPTQQRGPAPARRELTLGQLIFYGIIALIALAIFATNPSMATWLLLSLLSGGGGRRRGGGNWGGGFGGGGGGGWGGGGGFSGGGGSSGGGGASGSW